MRLEQLKKDIPPKDWDHNVRCPNCRLRFLVSESIGLSNKRRDRITEKDLAHSTKDGDKDG